MRIEDIIKDMIKEQGYTVKSFSEKIDIPYTTLMTMLKNDIGKSSIDNVIKIAQGLNVPVESLYDRQNNMKKITKLPLQQYGYIPEPVAAGIPSTIEGIMNLPQIEIPDLLMGKWAGNKDIVIMKVSGESMNNVIEDNSLMGVLRNINVKNLKDGDLVVFNHEYEFSIKRYFDSGDYIIFKPDSTDDRFKDIVIPKNSNLEITGKVVVYNVILN